MQSKEKKIIYKNEMKKLKLITKKCLLESLMQMPIGEKVYIPFSDFKPESIRAILVRTKDRGLKITAHQLTQKQITVLERSA